MLDYADAPTSMFSRARSEPCALSLLGCHAGPHVKILGAFGSLIRITERSPEVAPEERSPLAHRIAVDSAEWLAVLRDQPVVHGAGPQRIQRRLRKVNSCELMFLNSLAQ